MEDLWREQEMKSKYETNHGTEEPLVDGGVVVVGLMLELHKTTRLDSTRTSQTGEWRLGIFDDWLWPRTLCGGLTFLACTRGNLVSLAQQVRLT